MHLDRIDYVRVATGIFQYCGWLGETSTEVAGFANLHDIPGYDDNPYVITPRPNPTSIALPQRGATAGGRGEWYTLTGQRVSTLRRGGIYIHDGKKTVY